MGKTLLDRVRELEGRVSAMEKREAARAAYKKAHIEAMEEGERLLEKERGEWETGMGW